MVMSPVMISVTEQYINILSSFMPNIVSFKRVKSYEPSGPLLPELISWW